MGSVLMSVNREMKSRRTKRWLFAAIIAAVAMFVPSVASTAYAVAEPGDSVWIGSRQGHGGTGLFPIYLQTPEDPANPGEPDFWAYCIEHDVSAKTRLVGEIDGPSGFSGENYFTDPVIQGKVLWVLAHSYPAMSLDDFRAAANVPGLSRNDAIEAIQYAIWRYTDVGWDSNWNWSGSDDEAATEAAYWYLVNGANASSGMTLGDFETTVSITAPSGAQQADSLVGPFLVNTNRPTASVMVDPSLNLVDENGNAVDPSAVSDSQELYVDLRGADDPGTATLTATVSGSSVSGHIVTVPNPDPEAEVDHWQTLGLIAAAGKTTTAQASVRWAGAEAPAIGTTLTDFADGDHTLAWNGGTVVDTVAYQNLTPGIEYRVEGELMRKSDGSATGIVGSAVFTPSSPSGTVDVTFTVPTGYAGEHLVAFEELFETEFEGETAVAVHRDINDAAQTVLVEKASVTTTTSTAPNAPGKLANTGSDINGFAATAAALLLLSGAVLALARRRAQS